MNTIEEAALAAERDCNEFLDTPLPERPSALNRIVSLCCKILKEAIQGQVKLEADILQDPLNPELYEEALRWNCVLMCQAYYIRALSARLQSAGNIGGINDQAIFASSFRQLDELMNAFSNANQLDGGRRIEGRKGPAGT
jgi:hypothetical protein